MRRRMLGKGGGDGDGFILDGLSATFLDVLAFKKLTASAGDYILEFITGELVGFDSNNELSASSPVFDAGGVPTGQTFIDFTTGPLSAEISNWFEQTTGGVNYLVCGAGVQIVDNSGTDSFNFVDLYWKPNSLSVYSMNTASSAGSLPVSFYGFNKLPASSSNNSYYFGQVGLNPKLYQRQSTGLYRMRNGGPPFLSLGSPNTVWKHELAEFTSSGTNQNHYINNALNVNGTSNNTTQFTQMQIGAQAFFTFAMSIDGAMSSGDRTTLYDYMATYY